ncbi:hypothetical protein PC129_g25402 [Phytophthora cactorum]|nr:hypothetical protein C6341_g27953 [Phytophthora cactorum]KAG3181068.1 hypothetical protein PC129_g25402 [Phytophthora cactorum]
MLLSLNVETLGMSSSNVENRSPGSNVRDSSITYYKRGSKQKHTLDLNRLYKMSASQNNTPEIDDDIETKASRANAHTTNAGCLVSYGSGGSKHFRPSLSVDASHSNSYGKLCVPSRLSRHSSAASLGEPVIFEEKVIHNMNKLSRIIAI